MCTDVIGLQQSLGVSQGRHGDQALKLRPGLHVVQVNAQGARCAIDLPNLDAGSPFWLQDYLLWLNLQHLDFWAARKHLICQISNVNDRV